MKQTLVQPLIDRLLLPFVGVRQDLTTRSGQFTGPSDVLQNCQGMGKKVRMAIVAGERLRFYQASDKWLSTIFRQFMVPSPFVERE